MSHCHAVLSLGSLAELGRTGLSGYVRQLAALGHNLHKEKTHTHTHTHTERHTSANNGSRNM